LAKAGLSGKQEEFCKQYLVDLNATRAAIRAGYSERTAYSQGQRLLKKVEVMARIADLQADRQERTQISADHVLTRLAEIDEMDIADILSDDGSFLPIKQWPKVWRTTLSGIDVAELKEGAGDGRELVGLLKKVKWPDKLRNLELLGKHISVSAFSESINHNHKGEIRTITRKIVAAGDGE